MSVAAAQRSPVVAAPAVRNANLYAAAPKPATVPPATPATRPATAPSRRHTSLSTSAARLFFTLFTIAALVFGWFLAERQDFIPDEGVGYWLGIAGGSLLLIQLAYPLRKRVRFMRGFGSVKAWFRLHMALGILGPLLILYHCNFSLGATNSNVALIAMLVVASSGIIGRYFYGKIHTGFYGAHSSLQDLLAEATSLLTTIEAEVGGAGGAIAGKLTAFGTRVLRPPRSLISNLVMAAWMGISLPFVRWRLQSAARAAILRNAKRLNWNARERRAHCKAARSHISSYLNAVVRASELSFYERLFGLWHVLHLPLYLLLVVTGIVHVVAVHLY